ncbi:GNAT family N-acetyltransferase [Halpernia sp.]|uniref:GNAT family N-acetyltransferase n=1 Tax=Halpernia sp. TaxID=2782209 RepID=UPI003A8EFD15
MIKKISSHDTYGLRKNILGENIPNYQFIYNGDNDENTFHLGFFEHEILVGILTVMQNNENTFQFRGMAVSINQRGKNIGGKLLDFATDLIHSKAEKIWLNARKDVVPFYLKNGFEAEGDYFMIEPIGLHLKMRKLN